MKGDKGDKGDPGEFTGGELLTNHINDKNNPHGMSAEQIGAAPAGYGLGGSTTQVVASIDELDNLTKNGWYSFHGMGSELCGVWFDQASVFVTNMSEDYSVWQEIRPLESDRPLESNIVLKRHMFDGMWYEWEIENPPMDFGVVYRTTERHRGRSVYKKLISFGEFPQNSDKDVSTGIDASTYSIIGVHRHAKEIGEDAYILHLAKVTHEYIFAHDGVYLIHISTNGSQAVTAEYLIEYVEA